MKTDKFISLAEKRTNNAIKQIKLIGNLANPAAYEYTGEQVKKIISALSSEIGHTQTRFELASANKSEENFKL